MEFCRLTNVGVKIWFLTDGNTVCRRSAFIVCRPYLCVEHKAMIPYRAVIGCKVLYPFFDKVHNANAHGVCRFVDTEFCIDAVFFKSS